MEIRIAIDAMGGDYGPSVTVPASIAMLQKHPGLHLVLVGKEKEISAALPELSAQVSERYRILPASEVVGMDESPAEALRYKKDSSMRVAINLVKSGAVKACVSSGNTGALMATSRFVLKTLPGIDRPAIMTKFPTIVPGKEVHVLDLGANVDSSAEHLYQFAIMGAIATTAVDNIERPKVFLLNVGKEEIKGNDQVKKAAELFSSSTFLNYQGYIEGNALFKGEADVVVCDGFVGNVVLKACEGLSHFILFKIKKAFLDKMLYKLLGLCMRPVFKKIKEEMDPRKRNGATLLGLNGIVIKSHGGANMLSYEAAIEEAILEAKKNLPERIHQELDIQLGEGK